MVVPRAILEGRDFVFHLLCLGGSTASLLGLLALGSLDGLEVLGRAGWEVSDWSERVDSVTEGVVNLG